MATAGDRPGAGPERAYAPELRVGGELTLAADESHHLVRVRRVRAGDVVVLFDGAGTLCRGRLVTASPRAATVRIEGDYPARDPARSVRLALSLPEAGRADAMLSQLAELGVAVLQPLTFERTPRGRDQMASRRDERWGRVLREAAKVSGCSHLMQVAPVQRFDDWLGTPREQGVILLDPDPALPALAALLPPAGELPWLLLGPEGGLTEGERERALGQGARRGRLGVTALRIETAAAAAGAVAATLA